jgi:anti-sigma regulatory factor (Ser/Thr protein kinase)
MAVLRQRFAPASTSIREARQFVRDALAGSTCSAQLADDAALAVSELATNAALHGRTAYEVAVLLNGDCVRIEVADGNPRLPVPATPAPRATSGRGLEIVDRVADTWGVAAHQDGKVVWVELAKTNCRRPSPHGTSADSSS